MELSERRWALWCEAIRVWLLLTRLLLIRGSILNMSEILPVTMWAAYWWDCLKKTSHYKPAVVCTSLTFFPHPLEKPQEMRYCVWVLLLPKTFLSLLTIGSIPEQGLSSSKRLGQSEIHLRVLCFLERDNSVKGLPVITGDCQYLGRKSFRHSINGGTECCGAGVHTDPHLQPSAVRVGWRAVFDSDPVCIYILPGNDTDCWVHFRKLNWSRGRGIAALPPEELEKTCCADCVCRGLHQEN